MPNNAPLHAALSSVVLTATLAVSPPASAGAPVAVFAALEEADADALYQEGQAAFESGDFETATAKWEQSHEASGDPLVLYNIGQAYRAWYDKSFTKTHLKKARDALKKLSDALEEDPTLGDPEEVSTMLTEIEDKLERLEAEKPDETPEGPETPPEPEIPEESEEQKKGKKLRNTGIGLMAGGGALALTGIIVGGVFMGRGSSLTEEINTLYAMNATESQLDDVRARGRTANTLAGVGLGLGLALGGAAIGVGAWLFTKGTKMAGTADDTDDEVARVRIAPSPGGLVLHGRF